MEKNGEMKNTRPDPDALLKEISRESSKTKGVLKIFLGYAPGVGKTYAMLQQAQSLRERGGDIVVGVVETHGRQETEALLEGLEVIPLHYVDYQGLSVAELDLDALLRRKPAVALIDELAHTNAPGSRHPKRYQDVEELIEAGIDIYTAVNVQHFESQLDTVSRITGVTVQETVPDTVLESADEVQVVDIPLEELTQRLKDGKVYIPEQARRAMSNFFQRGNLVALRELTLTVAARKMGTELVNFMRAKAISGIWAAGERVMACISPGPYALQLLRKAYSIAKDANAEWYAVYVSSPSMKDLSDMERRYLAGALNLAEELGAKTITLTGSNVAAEIVQFAEENNITRVVVGKPLRSRFAQILRKSPVIQLIKARTEFELHLVTFAAEDEKQRPQRKKRQSWNVTAFAMSAVMVAITTIFNLALQRVINPVSLISIYLIATIGAALLYGTIPSLFASVMSLLVFDFFFTEPKFSFTMYHSHEIVSIVVFFFTSVVVGQLVKIKKQQDYVLKLRLNRVAVIEEMSKEFLMLPPVEQLIGGFTAQREEWKTILPVLRTTVLDDVGHIILKYVTRIADAPFFVLFTAQDGRLKVWAKNGTAEALGPHELAVAEWVYAHGEMAGAGTQTLADVAVCFMPMKSGDDIVGVVGLKYKYKDLLADQRRLLGAVVNLAALGAIRWARV